MSIFIWNSEIKNAYIWTTPVKEIYVGTTKVRPTIIERPDLDRYSLLWSTTLWFTWIHGIAISSDWTKLYAWPANWHIRQYTLTWGVLSGISWVKSETNSNIYTRWLYIKPDGSRLYSVSDNSRWYNIILPTPYSLSWFSSSYRSITWIVQNNNPTWVRFTPDWDYFFCCRADSSYPYLYKIPVSTAWDITAYTSVWATSVTLTQWAAYNVAISPTWLKMFVWLENTIYQYNLSTAWDITTATYSWKSLSVTWRWTFSVTENWDIFQTPTNSTGNVYQYRAS